MVLCVCLCSAASVCLDVCVIPSVSIIIQLVSVIVMLMSADPNLLGLPFLTAQLTVTGPNNSQSNLHSFSVLV